MVLTHKKNLKAAPPTGCKTIISFKLEPTIGIKEIQLLHVDFFSLHLQSYYQEEGSVFFVSIFVMKGSKTTGPIF